MTAKASKRHPRFNRPEIDERFRHALAETLRVPNSMVARPTALLAYEILSLVARRCAKPHMTDENATHAAMIAVMGTASATGMSHADFCGWLHRAADLLDAMPPTLHDAK